MNALLVGFCCFAADAVVTLVWLRLARGPSPVVRHAASALGTHALGVLTGAWFAGPFVYWPAAAVSGFGAVCWLFAFSAVYKSVSLRILSQLSRTPGHVLPFGAIASDYVRPEFEARVAVLVKMRCAEEVPGGYAATAAGNANARRIAGIQRACGIDASGLYGVASRAGHGTGESPQPVP